MGRPADRLQRVVEMIRGRIVHADDALHGMPGERQLAGELGVSRQTVRGAIRALEGEGWLRRLPNGRLGVALPGAAAQGGPPRRGPVIGFARSGGGTGREPEMWLTGIVGALAGRGTLREIPFDHFGDPSLAAALDGLDGLFFLPGGALPPWLAKKMGATVAGGGCRVAVLDFDSSAYGLPSISVFPAKAEWKLIEHLRALGHERIDCLNTQPYDPVIEARIEAWRGGLKRWGLEGELHSDERLPSIGRAYELVGKKLASREGIGAALLCVTGPAAVGALRACAEAGLAVGRDISIVAMNDEGLGPYLTPSLTSLGSPSREKFLRPAADWMVGGGPWRGPLLVEPKEIPMFVGESSGPVPLEGD